MTPSPNPSAVRLAEWVERLSVKTVFVPDEMVEVARSILRDGERGEVAIVPCPECQKFTTAYRAEGAADDAEVEELVRATEGAAHELRTGLLVLEGMPMKDHSKIMMLKAAEQAEAAIAAVRARREGR